MAKIMQNENSYTRLIRECDSRAGLLGKKQNIEKTTQNGKTQKYLCDEEQSMKKERLANSKTKESNDRERKKRHSVPKCSEYSDHMSGVNQLLQRKLDKELKYMQKEMLTICRSISDKQRNVQCRHRKLSLTSTSRKASIESSIRKLHVEEVKSSRLTKK